MNALLRRTVERLTPPGRAASAARTPVVIFGSGGSGTRTLQLLADRAGYFMGTNLNPPGDSLDIGRFMQRWLNRYLTKSNWVDEMCRGSELGRFESPRAMPDQFKSAIESHRAGLQDPAAPWGWKAPRTILMLPFVHEMYPAMKAVHLVRDGRDMAYSSNQNQVRAQGPNVLSQADLELGRPIRSIKFWARVNLAAARYGSRFVPGNYLRLRYEDVCSDPGEAVVRLLDFLESPASRESMRAVAAEVIQPSTSIRGSRAGSRPSWKEKQEKNPRQVEAVQRAGADALREFGYV